MNEAVKYFRKVGNKQDFLYILMELVRSVFLTELDLICVFEIVS